METSKNDRLIQKLRSASTSTVYQTLVEIRTKEVNSANGVALLRKRGVLRYVVKLLQKPNEKILDITLSILGNCCLENETRLELLRLGAVGPIVRILEAVGKDSIQGRTCRVLANLAQVPEVAAVVFKEGAVPAIVGILASANENNDSQTSPSSTSESTKQMAVRALRVLATSSEFRTEIQNQGGIRAVAELLSSTNEELQKAAVKALATLTQHCTEECANQVQGNVIFLERLVSFVWDPTESPESGSKKTSSFSQSALTCLANLARFPDTRCKLANAGAINAVLNQIRHASNLDLNEEWKLRDLVAMLCLFCIEPGNRMRLRDYGGLSQLLNHLKDDKHGPVAAALCNFAYDEDGLRELIEFGLIQICADHLRDVISVKLSESGRSHAFIPRKKEPLPKKIQNRRLSIRARKSSPDYKGAFREDFSQSNIIGSQEQKIDGSLEEHSKKLLKSPLKASSQKTFRVSSPSYQAVRNEQVGFIHCNSTCSSPPSTNTSSTFLTNSTWNGNYNAVDFNSSSSSLLPGSNSSFSLSNFFQVQSPSSQIPLNLCNSQFQEVPLSPETSSCCSGSGGSSSSCTSGYGSSPRSDLSDAPSPSSGSSLTTTVNPGEVYSPVYEDGSDDSGDEKLEVKNHEENEEVRNDQLPCSKRMRKDESSSNENPNALSPKEPAQVLLITKSQESSECSIVLKEAFLKAAIVEHVFEIKGKLLDEGNEEKIIEDEGNGKKKSERSLVDYLLLLLSCASVLDDPVEELASHNTFSALLDYHIISQNPAPRATRVLTRIVRNYHYFIPLINQRFVLLVRSGLCFPYEHHDKDQNVTQSKRMSLGREILSQWKECSECIRLKSLGMSLLMDLATTAESGFGEGELAYGLLKGGRSHRMAIALSLPFIIRAKKMLRKLLFGCKGFMILLDILREYGNDIEKLDTPLGQKEKEENIVILNAAVDGISYLANAVGVSMSSKNYSSNAACETSPSTSKQSVNKIFVNHGKIKPYLSLDDSNDKVVVSLDDGSLVNVSREGLSNISPVFRAMLQGNFLESKERSFKLPGVSHFCLNYILHHFGECPDIGCINLNSRVKHSFNTSNSSSASIGNSCDWANRPAEVYTALELVSIADRFLLPDEFRKNLADQVLDLYLSPESAPKIYRWCLGSEGINGTRAPEGLGLLEGTIKYILVGDMTLTERVSLIKAVFDSGLCTELLSDMNDIIRISTES